MTRLLPVIFVGGFLGAGKTSLLHNFVSEYQGGSLAVLADDYGHPNLDARAIKGLCGAMRRTRDTVLPIPSVAVSEQAGWLTEQLRFFSEENRYDCVLIECNGMKDIAEFGRLFEPAARPSSLLSTCAQLQQIIYVADALDLSQAIALARQRGEPPQFSLLQHRQLAGATVLILNKCDLITDSEMAACVTSLRSVNAHARLIQTAYGEVPPELWQKLLTEPPSAHPSLSPASDAESENAIRQSSPEVLRAASFQVHRPFHPERFWQWFNGKHSGLVRVKGLVWLATRNLLVGGISRTRWENGCGGAGIWWAALPREEWPSDPETLLQMHETWREPFGDRRQELVLVGEPPALPEIVAQLESCLLTDEELARSPLEWQTFADPFPTWDVGEESS